MGKEGILQKLLDYLYFKVGATLLWIAEKTIVPSNFHRLLKLIFLGSWMFVCKETHVNWKAMTSAFISYGFRWWQWIMLVIILVWKLCFVFWRRVSFLRSKLVWRSQQYYYYKTTIRPHFYLLSKWGIILFKLLGHFILWPSLFSYNCGQRDILTFCIKRLIKLHAKLKETINLEEISSWSLRKSVSCKRKKLLFVKSCTKGLIH